MIKVENVDITGWEAAIRGMRNPLSSWDKSDSERDYMGFWVGHNDLYLMRNLAKSGSDHAKYRRMIIVYADVTAPLYWWKEFDTYKVGTVSNSCSTMHKIHAKEFTVEDFSYENLGDEEYGILETIILSLNWNRRKFNANKDKSYWWNMIQLLPSSYNQRRTVQLNYEVLANMYHSRKNHKLDEWRQFCSWVESLPHSEIITG